MDESRTPFQEQVAALRRTQILEAAIKVFAQRGFHRATIRDVAKAAGVADGTVYNYFENKTALLLGILNHLNETEQRAEDLAQSADMDLREFCRTYFKQRLDVFTSDSLQAFQVVLSEVLVNAELRELFRQQVIAPTFELAEAQFGALQASGRFPVRDVPLALRLMSATIFGLLMLRVMGDPQLQAKWDALPDLVTTMLFDGLLTDDGGSQNNHAER